MRADNLGKPIQQVFVDGVAQTLREAQVVFSGPQDSLFELRLQDKQWVLAVNGTIVEDLNPSRASGDESLRALRSRPDGAYLIQPHFDAGELDLNIVRKFNFIAHGRVHEVSVAHSCFKWQVLCNGNVIDQVAHKRSDSSGEVVFDIEVAPREKVHATFSMTWENAKWQCQYDLKVRTEGISGSHIQRVPFSWSSVGGEVAGLEPLVIVQSEDLGQPGVTSEPVRVQQVEPPEDELPQNLPQGVSFDSATGSYQANIRATTGRFIFLGEFSSPEQAHQRYLEAVPVHCPGKQLAPDLR